MIKALIENAQAVQAFTGVVQVFLALALIWVTWRYVQLTGELVKLQADIVNLQKQGERRELYDRRTKVYESVMAFLGAFMRDVEVELPAIGQLYRDTREAEFLFGEEIPAFIERLATDASEHRSLQKIHAVASGDMKRLNRIHELENRLISQAFKEAKEKFGCYLKLMELEAESVGEQK